MSSGLIEKLKVTTPARIGIGHAGFRYTTRAELDFRKDYALARDAVCKEVSCKLIEKLQLIRLNTLAKNRNEYLMHPSLGKQLDGSSVEKIQAMAIPNPDVQILVSDGLSADAFDNVPEMLEFLLAALQKHDISVGPLFFVHYARVSVMDHVGGIVKPKAALILIGERPGLGICDSLSAYFEYAPCTKRVESDRNVLSNIHNKGIPPSEAGLMVADALNQVLTRKQSGMNVRFDWV